MTRPSAEMACGEPDEPEPKWPRPLVFWLTAWALFLAWLGVWRLYAWLVS